MPEPTTKPRPGRVSGEPLVSAGRTRSFLDREAAETFAYLTSPTDPAQLRQRIDRLSMSLLTAIRRHCDERGEISPTPVLVLRGGLLMLDAVRVVLGPGPWGFLLPGSRPRGAPVVIERVDLPLVAPGGGYLLIDPVVNTGQTILASLATLHDLDIDVDTSIQLASLFLTERGETVIRDHYPSLSIHTIWSGMTVEPNGWITGIGFDAGDCAVGGGDNRLRWTASVSPQG